MSVIDNEVDESGEAMLALLDLAQKLSDDDPEIGCHLLISAAACLCSTRELFLDVVNEVTPIFDERYDA